MLTKDVLFVCTNGRAQRETNRINITMESDAGEVKALKMDSTCESLYEDSSNNNGIIGNSSTSSSTGSCSDTDQRGHTGDDQEMEEEDEEEEEEEDKEIIKRIENEEMKIIRRKEGVDDEEMTLGDDGNDNDGNQRQEADRAGRDITNAKAVTPIIIMPPPTNRIDILDEDEEEDDDDDDDDDDNNDDIYKSNFVVIKSPDPSTPTRTWSVEGPKLHIPQPPQRHLHLAKPQVQQAPKPYLHPQHQKQQQLSGQQLKMRDKQIHNQPIKNYTINPVNTGKARGVAGATHVTGSNEVPIKSGRGRGITLNMLMKDGVIEPGGGCLSIEYLGKKFSADLLPNGKIRWQENNEIFNSPSAWASHCKKLVNPSKKSGCGWASIKYKGRKLVSWKSMWCRKQRQNSNPSSKLVSSPLDECPAEIMKSNLKLKDMFPKVPDYELGHCPSLKPPLPAHINQCHKSVTNGKNKKRQHVDWSPNEFQEEALNLSLKGGPENIQKTRQSPQQQPQQQQQQSPQQQRSHHQQQHSPQQQRSHHQQQHSPQQQRNHHKQHHHQSPTSPLSIPPPLPPPPVPTPPQQHQKLKQKQLQQQHHHHHQQSQPKQPQQQQQPKQQQQQQPKQQPQPKHSDPHSEILDPTHPRFPLVKHSNLLNRNADQDPNTLVQCETFESYGKFQPFSVSVTTNSMFLIDFHCHLTNSEVLGYLAGRWDQNTQHLNILQAFPCLSRLGDKENAPLIEAEIRHRMNKSGLSLVGWYHSHPHRSASPTIRDIDCQMTYQLKMKGIGSTYHPCLGFIIAPYDKTSKKKESTFQAFWVMPPPMDQPSDYGIPMEVQFSIYQNPSLTEELLTEMKNLVDFYKGSPDVVRFANIWQKTVTYLDKVKWSLLTKLPQDQDENSSTLEFVRTLLLSMRL